MIPLALSGPVTGALIALGGALAGSVVSLVTYLLGRKVPDDVAAFSKQAAGTLDGVRQALLAFEVSPDKVATRAENVAGYLGTTEYLLGAAILHLRGRAEDAAKELITALRRAEEELQRAAAKSGDAAQLGTASAAYDDALAKRDDFVRAARSTRR